MCSCYFWEKPKNARGGAGAYRYTPTGFLKLLSPDTEYSPATVNFHGIPTLPALLSLSGKIFGIDGLMHIQALFFILAIVIFYMMMQCNLKLGRLTSVISTGIFTLSPIILWVSKSALAEICLALMIITFLYFITSDEEYTKKILWLPIGAYSFFHVSIYTLMPLFVILFVLLYFQRRSVWFIISGIAAVGVYNIGFISMVCSIYGYTLSCYKPLANLLGLGLKFRELYPFIFAISMLCVLLLSLFYVCFRKKDIYMEKHQFIISGLIKALTIITLIVAGIKWLDISFVVPLPDDIWKYYKGLGLLASIQNLTISAFACWTGVIFFILLIAGIIKKDEILTGTDRKSLPITIMLLYAVFFYSAFLNTETRYFHYYSRYIAPFIPIILVLGGYYIDRFRVRSKIFIASISILIVLPFSTILAVNDDTSRMDFGTFVRITDTIKKLEQGSTIIVDNSLSQMFYYPIESLSDKTCLTTFMYTGLKDKSFVDKDKPVYLPTESNTSLKMVSSWEAESSLLGIGTRPSKILEVLHHISNKYNVYLYDFGRMEFAEQKISSDYVARYDIQEKIGSYYLLNEKSKIDNPSDLSLSLFNFQGRSTDGHLAATNGPLHVMYGPYVYLEAGSYLFTVDCELIEGNEAEVVMIDAGEFFGKEPIVLSQIDVLSSDFVDSKLSIHIPVITKEDIEKFELRVFAYKGVSLKITGVSVQLLEDE
jgi:hypothetical protein